MCSRVYFTIKYEYNYKLFNDKISYNISTENTYWYATYY